ncbi:MAG: MaoC family dehydratase N-terminal domain-containing protein, partial [Pyrinomonadaceae bacterium]
VYLSQTMKFTAPVFIGDTVTTTGRIIDIREKKGVVTLETVCTNQDGKSLVEGVAVVMILK